MYADDTTLAVADKCINTIEKKLNEDLCTLYDWFCKNKLSLNAEKTQVMLVGTIQNIATNAKNIKLNVTVNNVTLEEVSSAKLLGVYVDKSLDWKVHIQKLCGKISKKLGLLRRLKSVIPQSALRKLFNAIVLPNFDYCDIIWGNCCQDTLHSVEMLQKQAARILLGARRYSHTQPLFARLKWIPLV